MADTKSILIPLLGALFKSPLVLILTLGSLALSLGVLVLGVSILVAIGMFVSALMDGADLASEAGSFLGAVMALGVWLMIQLNLTTSTWKSTLAMARDVRDETNQAREAVDQRAERKAKIEAQGGQISVAPEAGAQGQLTRVEGREGLEPVEGGSDEEGAPQAPPPTHPGDL